jgi:2-amino-4-hydroxy-6-hydroxymethyldihydropteridine diphosphokinase
MQSAVSALDAHPQIRVDFQAGIASLYETSPVGGPPDQKAYLNSAIRVTTTLSPEELLSAVLSIEKSLGRERKQRWEARIIDIDLLLYDDVVIEDDALSLPHPRLHERRFVLGPMAEIAGTVVHPVLKLTIADLAESLRTTRPHQMVTSIAEPQWFSKDTELHVVLQRRRAP